MSIQSKNELVRSVVARPLRGELLLTAGSSNGARTRSFVATKFKTNVHIGAVDSW